MFLSLLLHPQGCSGPRAAPAPPPCSAQQDLSPPRAGGVEREQKEMGKDGHSPSELLSAQKQGGNHLHPLPQPWLIAAGAAASAITWRKDPVPIPGGIRSDLMETCEATRPHFLTWGSTARSGICLVPCLWLCLLSQALNDAGGSCSLL